jgi:hypothetical protein
MMLFVYCFVLGLLMGIPLWLIRQVLRPHARGVAALRRDEAVPTEWVPVIMGGQVVHATQEAET